MRIIAVMSPKGGIGKTTTSDAIAYMLGEEQEKRVLILDGDPQGDTSKTFEAYEPEGTGMSELLERHVSVGGSYRTTDLIRPTQYSHIDIIPANGYLMQTDMKLLLKQEANKSRGCGMHWRKYPRHTTIAFVIAVVCLIWWSSTFYWQQNSSLHQ